MYSWFIQLLARIFSDVEQERGRQLRDAAWPSPNEDGRPERRQVVRCDELTPGQRAWALEHVDEPFRGKVLRGSSSARIAIPHGIV